MIPPFIPVAEDVDAIMRVMAEAFDPDFGEAWNRRQVEDALRIGNCHYLLSHEGDEVAGFALSRHGFEEEELLLFAVRPKYRGKRIGYRLLVSFLEAARQRKANRVFLEMREGNPAKALYEGCGFAEIGRRPDYYRTAKGARIDAITYGCELNSRCDR